MLRLLRSTVKNESSIHEIVKKKKDIHASFAVAPQTAKVTAICASAQDEKISYDDITFVQ